MTTHNLQDHLTWLLESKPHCDLGLSAALEAARIALAEDPFDSLYPVLSQEIEELSISTRDDAGQTERSFPAIKYHPQPKLPQTDMARLQSAPRSTQKSSLLSRTPAGPAHAQDAQVAPLAEASSHIRCPGTQDQTKQGTLQDKPETESDEDVVVPAKRSERRMSGLNKGRKRKSEEFDTDQELGRFADSNLFRDSQSSFKDIDAMLLDENPPPYATLPPKATRKCISPSKSNGDLIHQSRHIGNDIEELRGENVHKQLSNLQTVPGTPGKQYEIYNSLQESPSHLNANTSRKRSTTALTPADREKSSGKKKRRDISDSEEELGEILFSSQYSVMKAKADSIVPESPSKISYPKLPCDQSTGSIFSQFARSPSRKPGSPSKHKRTVGDTDDLQQSSASIQIPQRKDPAKVHVRSSPSNTPLITSSAMKSKDLRFNETALSYAKEELDAHIENLQRDLNQLFDVYLEYRMEGMQVPPAMAEKQERLEKQIRNVEHLETLRSEIVELSKEMQRYRDLIREAWQRKENDEHIVQSNLIAKKRLEAIDTQLSRIIPSLSLPDRHQQEIKTPAVMVQSTQTTSRLQTDSAWAKNAGDGSKSDEIHETIHQTPTKTLRNTALSRHLPNSHREIVTEGRQDDKIRLSTRDVTSSRNVQSPKRSAVRQQTKGNLAPKASSSMRHQEFPPVPSRFSERQETQGAMFDIPDCEGTMFNMAVGGSDFEGPGSDDDYGCDDDHEMLDSVIEIERQQPIPTASNRKVLAETPGNVSRSPSKRAKEKAIEQTPPFQMQFPWSRDVKAAMRGRFHLKGFRHNQCEAINATLSGRDVFVLMPTGGGKSLCYQLPAIIASGKTRGVTIVISPLLSLMQDQVDHLQKLSIQAFQLNGESSSDQRRFLLNGLRDPNVEKLIQILYLTPEMFNVSQITRTALSDLYRNKRLARIVIDEAHCVSQWGHDFRPDYKEIGSARELFPNVPVMALTATATENVKVDVIHNLGIKGCAVFTQSFNRPNLTYEIRKKSKGSTLEEMAKLIKTQYRNQSGIIYCLARKSCEETAKKLSEKHGVKAYHYHAGMEADERRDIQKGWQAGKYDVIVATIAFGMGIDKPDVRFVIHHTIPKSLEGYYQETGRAGRDGEQSGCYLFYSYQDAGTLRRMIDKGDGDWQQKERQRQMLRNVIQFCENQSDCRRVQVLQYFNESFRREDCEGGCDNCISSSTFEEQDYTEYARQALKMVKEITSTDDPKHNNFSLLHCVDVLRGGKSKKIKDYGHESLEYYGLASHLERGDVERLLVRLLSEGALVENNQTNKKGFTTQYILPGRNSDAYLKGSRTLRIQVKIHTPKTKQKQLTTRGRQPPTSTMVSSPLAATRRLRRKQSDITKYAFSGIAEAVESGEDTYSTLSTDEDGFAPVRDAGKPQPSRRRELGPPIDSDDRLGNLDEMHQLVVEGFMNDAKQECSRIMTKKGLTFQPFTDTVLREMAIRFPIDLDNMRTIPGINVERVKLYGPKFLALIEAAQRSLEDIRGRPSSTKPNEVINLLSDDDFAESGDSDYETAGERSAHFDNTVGAEYMSQYPLSPPKTSQRGRAQSGSGRGRGRGKRGARKVSGGAPRPKSTASKRMSYESTTTRGEAGPSRKIGGGRGGGTASVSRSAGILAMPT